jgi:PKD repeat protein
MKKIYPVFLLIACLFALNTGFAQNESEYTQAKKYLDKKGEVYFHFQVNNPSELLTLTNIISIDNVKNGEVWAYANNIEFDKFLTKHISYQVLPHPGDAIVEMWDQSKGIWQFDTYPTYSEYLTMMNTFASTYPNLCHLDTIATLASGRKLLALKITDNPNVDENEPEVFYTGGMHGDEITGSIIFLRLANYLLTNYGTNSRVSNIVNNIELWICPFSNPDGTYYAGDNNITGARRNNANNIDLNRNYPDPRAGQHPDGNAWQPENIAWMAFADAHDFVMAANTHGGAEVVNFPWDTWISSQRTHADDNWWRYVSKEYADTAKLYGTASYLSDVVLSGYTEGGDWYVITGGRQDYMNYFKHCREVTLELSSTKLVTASTLPNYWNYNYRSFLNYLEHSLYGVRGIITDACSGLPIKAKVFVNTHDVDSSHVYSSLPVGNYHRPILAGIYSITYSAPGYISQTITGVTVANKASVTRNIQLVPIAPIANFSADHTTGCNASIQFTDISGAPSGSTFLWNFGDGQTSTLQNPMHSYATSGTYTVTLAVSSCPGNDSEIKTNYITISLPTAPLTTSAQICGTNSLALGASGSGTLNWYDAASAGNLVNTGTNYNTPTLTSTTTYYVESSSTSYGTSQNVPSPAITAATTHNTAGRYEIFDVIAPIKLVSVQVRTTIAGNRTIELRNSAGTVINSATVNIPIGTTRITLNFDIPIGTDYQLGLSSTSTINLFRNTPTVTYPYQIAGLVSITNSSAGLTAYYFYYDWEVQPITSCTSGRTSVTATILPVPTANAGTDQAICNGSSTNITATGGGTYLWSQGGITSGISVTPTTTTTYTVTVTNAQLCTSTDNIVVTVNQHPTTNAGTDQTIATGATASLNGSASGGSGSYSYHWEPSALLVNANVANPTTIALNTTTQFTLTTTDINTTCTGTDNIIVTVAGGILSCTVSGTPPSVCLGESTQLIANPTGGSGIYTYQWASSPVGFNSTIYNPTVTPNANTTYFLTVTDGTLSANATIIIAVNSLPIAEAGSNQTICEGQTANITATGGTSYLWDNSAGNTANVAVSPTTTTTYTVTVTNSTTCTSTDFVTVNVNPLPFSNFTFSSTDLNVTFTNLSVGAISYMWYFGDGGISSQADPNYNYATDGTYLITLIAHNACGNDTLIQSITVSVNTISENNLNLINVYPNPSKGIFTIENLNVNDASIRVTDISGRILLETNINRSFSKLNLNELSDGLYFLTIISENNFKTIPIAISR